MNAKREARRKRDREDFVRITTQRLEDVGQHKHATSGRVGANAGPTYREHLENELERVAKTFERAKYAGDMDKTRTMRGMIRGLAIALALHENSYDASTEAIKKIERSFLK